MKLYMKQKVFSWGDKFRIWDENETDVLQVKGEAISLGKKLHVYDMQGEEVAYIHQKVMSILTRFFVTRDGKDEVEIVKELSLLHPKYSINGPDWAVEGDLWAHNYTITSPMGRVATVSKQWFTWGDSYEIDIADHVDWQLAVCVVLAIDAAMAAAAAAASSSH